MAIYRKSHLVQGKLAQASWSLPRRASYLWLKELARSSELELAQASWSLPKRAGCLGLKAFHGSGESNASLGELGSREVHKMTLLPSFPCIFLFS